MAHGEEEQVKTILTSFARLQALLEDRHGFLELAVAIEGDAVGVFENGQAARKLVGLLSVRQGFLGVAQLLGAGEQKPGDFIVGLGMIGIDLDGLAEGNQLPWRILWP